jgi:hypothetical protein
MTNNSQAYNQGVEAALSTFQKEASSATPYVLAIPGAILGGHRAHKKKNPIVPSAFSGAIGTSLGGTFGGYGGLIAGMHAGKAVHNLLGSANHTDLIRRVRGGGNIGAVLGASAGLAGGYHYMMNRHERSHKRMEDFILKKHNVKK